MRRVCGATGALLGTAPLRWGTLNSSARVRTYRGRLSPRFENRQARRTCPAVADRQVAGELDYAPVFVTAQRTCANDAANVHPGQANVELFGFKAHDGGGQSCGSFVIQQAQCAANILGGLDRLIATILIMMGCQPQHQPHRLAVGP